MATFIALANITIGDFTFRQIHSAIVKSTWHELADTATIALPLASGTKVPDSYQNESVIYRLKNGQVKQMKQGDFVQIQLGYQKGLRTWMFNEFRGFVKRIGTQIPLEIECEDATYLFRRVNLKKLYEGSDVKAVVQGIVDEVNKSWQGKYTVRLNYFVNQSVKVDKLRLNNVNAAQALQEIKEKVPGMVCFFREADKVVPNQFDLYVGLAYVPVDEQVVKYNFDENIHKNNLVFNKAEDKKIRVKVTGKDKSNKRVVIYKPVLDNGGELIQFKTEIISDKESLQKIADQIYARNSFSGMEGNIETYLLPQARHSQVANIVADEYKLLNGGFLIDAVDTSFTGTGGIKRTVTIGKQLS